MDQVLAGRGLAVLRTAVLIGDAIEAVVALAARHRRGPVADDEMIVAIAADQGFEIEDGVIADLDADRLVLRQVDGDTRCVCERSSVSRPLPPSRQSSSPSSEAITVSSPDPASTVSRPSPPSSVSSPLPPSRTSSRRHQAACRHLRRRSGHRRLRRRRGCRRHPGLRRHRRRLPPERCHGPRRPRPRRRRLPPR